VLDHATEPEFAGSISSSGVWVWASVLGDDITILRLSCRYIRFVCAGALDINDCSNSRDADFLKPSL
jgi:hypothetical protein